MGLSISVVIPAYNEEKRIGRTLKAIQKYLDKKKHDYEIIVVDDGSNDKTIEVAKSFSSKNKRIKILKNKENRGKGYSVKTGMLAAKKKYVLFSDADLSTPIEELEKFSKFKEKYDIIIASRALKQSNIKESQPFYRVLMGKTFNLIVNLVLFLGIHDTQCGFKLFSRKSAQEIFKKQTFERFSFDNACIADYYHHAPYLDNLAITMVDENGHFNIFWTPLIKRIERGEANTTVQFKDSSIFSGRWAQNKSPIDFYEIRNQGYATGLIPANDKKDGEEPRYRIAINNIKSIEFDTAQENENFRKSLESFMSAMSGNKRYSAKKIVELKDGTRISTDFGYIVDCCGHHGGNRWHERMLYFCSIYNPKEEGNSTQRKHVTNTFLTEISEIELTGKFDEKNKQCREAVIRYVDGREEKKSLFLTSESYVGTCYPSQPYREHDKIALHNKHGALLVPLDEVKKIIIPYEKEAAEAPAEEMKDGSP